MKTGDRNAPEIAVAMGGCVTRLAALMNFSSQRSSQVIKRLRAAVMMGAVAASVILGHRAQAQSAVMAVDTANRKVHVAGNADQKRAVGGLAKIATTMVVLDWSEASKVSLNVLATVPDYAQRIAGQTALGLQPGDKLTLRDLIYATMMGSDNVAAITLGHFVGADLLAPEGYGEVIGGGERASDLQYLLDQIVHHQLNRAHYEWYLDVRKYGSVPHAGFGMGLERAVAWMCKLPHVRETIPYPRMMGTLRP